ncbi:lithostathine-like [Sorex fumeus]|uniref:lithostathine-like n=1 Tax=Sorex fumeus TaxID=62283 RepID=UPI0024ACEFC5|nr:lithostathine-like [Sorex fumeus]
MTTVAWMVLACLVLQARVKGEDLQNEELSPKVRCPKGSTAYGHHCYAFFKTEKSWMDAHTECQKRRNGHLVSVLTQSEGYFVSSLIKNSGAAPPLVWIGLHDSTEVRLHLLFTGYEKWQNYDCWIVMPYVCKFES